MFEIFDHTADVGLRIRARSLDEIFRDAAYGLFSLIIDNPEIVQPEVERRVQLGSDSLDMLLFDWLDHLLYLFDGEHLVLAQFDVSIRDLELSAIVRGEPLNPARHALAHEVKAITYHGLFVQRVEEDWLAEVIVDI